MDLAIAVEVRLLLAHALELRQLLLAVGRIAHAEHALDPTGSLGDAAAVREAVEAGPAAVGALARLAHAAELQRRDGGVEEAVVDRGAARPRLAQHPVRFRFVAERVHAQRRLVQLVGDADGFVEVVDGVDGDDGTEGLVDEQGVVHVIDLHDRGFEEPVGFVHGAAYEDLALRLVEHLLQPLPLSVVDDARVVGRVLDAGWVELFDHFFELFEEGGQDLFVDEDAVLRDADLPCVDGLCPVETPRCELGIGVLGDDGWVAPSELEGDGSKSLSCFLGDDGADCCAASIEDLVPFLVQECRGLWNGTLDDLVAGGVETLIDNLLQDCRGMGRVLAGLENDGASCTDGSNHGAQGELNGEVICASTPLAFTLAVKDTELLTQ